MNLRQNGRPTLESGLYEGAGSLSGLLCCGFRTGARRVSRGILLLAFMEGYDIMNRYLIEFLAYHLLGFTYTHSEMMVSGK